MWKRLLSSLKRPFHSTTPTLRNLTPGKHTDLPMTVHIYAEGDTDEPHGLRTKSFDQGTKARGSTSSTFLDSAGQIHHIGKLNGKSKGLFRDLVGAWHIHNYDINRAYADGLITAKEHDVKLQENRSTQPEILQKFRKKSRRSAGGRRNIVYGGKLVSKKKRPSRFSGLNKSRSRLRTF